MDKKSIFRRLRYVYLFCSILCLVIAILYLRKFTHQEINTSYEAPSDYVEEVTHKVLLLCSYNSQYYTYNEQIDGFNDSLCAHGVEYDVMFMDGKNYSSRRDHVDFYRFFEARMKSGIKYEGVIIVDDEALEFACYNRDILFKDIPIVFIGINDLKLARKAVEYKDVTGFYENDYLDETMGLAVKLLPARRTIYGLYDDSAAGRSDGKRFKALQENYPDYKFIPINTSRYTHEELIEEIERIPDEAMIFYMTCFIDSEKKSHSIYEMTYILRTFSDAPIFRCYESGVGDGVLGSVGMYFYEQAKMAGETMYQVLEGQADADKIGLKEDTPAIVEFDYALMEKYGVDEKLLPDNVVIINKNLTFTERYGDILLPVFLILSSLIFLFFAAFSEAYQANMTNAELLRSKEQLEKSQERLRYQAEHDDFLDILNRRSAVEFMRNNTNPGSCYSVVMVDIDNFKDINETYGHQIADEILKYISLELEVLAKENGWMLARYGGDEFLIMVKIERVTESSPTVDHIMEIFRTPISIGDETIAMTCRMGISDQHIMNAEMAMFEAKNRGRNKAYLFSSELKKKVRDDNKIKAKILQAIDSDGFYMVYQPQVDTATKEITGYEALVRMKNDELSPGIFIPIAESSGWVGKIGRITTELVLKQIDNWRSQGYTLHPVSINYSSSQLNDTGYIDFLKEKLILYNIPGELIEIEVTEGTFLEKTKKAEELFTQLQELGIKILMDDFGTGYSSLGYLTYIPVDVIKLDKSLVDAYLVDGKDAFIRDVILLAHDLDKKIIIEGVEEKWQYERLKEFKADVIQGYYFSKPLLPAQAIVFDAKTVG